MIANTETPWPDQEERLARLALYLGLNTNTAAFHRVVSHAGSAMRAFEGVDLTVMGVNANLPALLSEELFKEAHSRLKEAAAKGLEIIIWGDDHFPLRLNEIPAPPPALWVKGRLEPGDKFSVGLVGSRAASSCGLASARRLAREGAQKGLTIVSGLAKGIDAQAHWGALEEGGRTLAILGSGLDWVYPKENARLYEAIPASGALISEFPPEIKPLPVNFPRRNKIIAGLSLAVVVVEARERSGALITARQTLEMNREVMALPGQAGAQGVRGGNQLIKNGAALVENMAEVITEIKPRLLEGLSSRPKTTGEATISPPQPEIEDIFALPGDRENDLKPGKTAKKRTPLFPKAKEADDLPEPGSPGDTLLKLLASGPMDTETMVQRSGLSVSELSLIILNFELAGKLIRLESGLYQTAK